MDNYNDEIQSRNNNVSLLSLLDNASPNAPVINRGWVMNYNPFAGNEVTGFFYRFREVIIGQA